MPDTMIPRPGRRWGRIALIATAAVILLPIAAAGIALAVFDVNTFKPRVIAMAKQTTGRDLALNGPIALKWSLRPAVELRDATFSNPPGLSRPSMLTLERLELRLDITALLRGRIEVNRVLLVKPDIRLETDKQGNGNWKFTPQAPDAATSAAAGGSSGPKSSRPVDIKEIAIQGGTIAFQDGKTGRATMVSVASLTASAGADAPLRVSTEGTYNAVPFKLALETAPVSRLIAARTGTPLPLDASLHAAGATIAIKGKIDDVAALTGADFTVSVQAPDAAALAALAGQATPPVASLSLETQIRDGSGGLGKSAGLHGIKITTPGMTLTGDIAVTLGASRPALAGTLAAARIDLDAMRAASPKTAAAPKAAAPESAGGPVPPVTAPTVASDRLFPDQPTLPFNVLKAVDADIRLTIGELLASGVTYHAIAAHPVLRDGVLRIDQAALDMPGGHLEATVAVDSTRSPAAVAVALKAPALDLKPLLSAYGQPAYASGHLELLADVHGTGVTPRAIAASLTGVMGLAIENGVLDGRIAGAAVTKAVPKLPIGDLLGRGGDSALRCLAVRLDPRDGIAAVHVLTLNTALLNAHGGGTLNLRDETLALRIVPQGRVAGAGFAVPIRVGGPLRRPGVGLDTEGAAMSNAGTLLSGLAGIAIPGGGKVTFGDSRGVEDCAGPLALARGQTPPAQTAAPSPGSAPGSPLGPSDTGGAQTVPDRASPPNPAGLLRQLFR